MKMLIDGTVYNDGAWDSIRCGDGVVTIIFKGGRAVEITCAAVPREIMQAEVRRCVLEEDILEPRALRWRAYRMVIEMAFQEVFKGDAVRVYTRGDADILEARICTPEHRARHEITSPPVFVWLLSGKAKGAWELTSDGDVVASGDMPNKYARQHCSSLTEMTLTRENLVVELREVKKLVMAAAARLARDAGRSDDSATRQDLDVMGEVW